jgi:DNA-directed RNA polymerase subunit RPC12/RpoP
MSFICPDCSGKRLRIACSLELAPDSWWDEITLQVVECPDCGFRGAAVCEESRRGALDSEAWNHWGVRLAEAPLRTLIKDVAACPEPRSSACRCAAHQKWGRTDATGRWLGLGESAGRFPLIPV